MALQAFPQGERSFGAPAWKPQGTFYNITRDPMSFPQSRATFNATRVFGLPLGDFGLFASLLISFSSGFLAFFATAFVSILGILFYNSFGHHSVDYAASYKFVALPVGIVVLAVSLATMLSLWVRRKVSGK